MMRVDTPIYDQMVDDGYETGFDRYITNTAFNRIVEKEMKRWAELLERLK